jgi:hypothetical protein
MCDHRRGSLAVGKFPARKKGERPGWVGVYARMNAKSCAGKTLSVALGLSLTLWVGCASTATRSSTVIQPPAPPGLPKPPALRVPNPPGVEPPSVGNLIRVEREPPAQPPGPQEAPTSPQPYPEAVWQPGYYAWLNNQYTWVPGRWERPPQGRTAWVAPRWERRDNGYVFIEGYWR